jgi:uncharacterized protein (TIGR03663 family)
MNRWLTLGLLLAVAAALLLRLPHLNQRPLHTDESVHAVKFLGLWEGRGYRYDPNEYHGPILYYVTLPFVWLSGARGAADLQAATLRLVPLTFGIGLILLLPLLGDALGRPAIFWAALWTAVSPAFVFYSRYYIHELPLVFFTLLLLAAGWRYLQTRRLGWALLAGAALGLMHATKETFVFNLVALAAAALLAGAWEHWRAGALWFPELRLRRRHLLAALGVAAVVSVVLFTSFFTNASGPLDSIRTYLPWLHRAGGVSPHEHPWPFYFKRLLWFHKAGGPVWTEMLIWLLAIVGLVTAFTNHSLSGVNLRFVRFLGFYTLCLTAIYNVLPYKTPWCVLGFHHGFILLAGVGAVALLAWCGRRRWLAAVIALALFAGAGQLAVQARRAAITYAADPRNPWVYAHTSPDLLRLVAQINAITATQPRPDQTLIKVFARGGDYWPLPWYLRAYPHVGWWSEVPPDPYAPIIVASSSLNANLDEKSDKRFLMVGLFQQRPGVGMELYVEFNLWKKYLEMRPPPQDEE